MKAKIFDWAKLCLENIKAVLTVITLLGVSGYSIYGNVNQTNPWIATQAPTINVIVESNNQEQAFKAAIAAHIQEYH